MSDINIADKLKELRAKAGLTQKTVYEKLGIPQSTFSSWEIGKAEPSANMLLKLCDIYDAGDILTAFGYDGYNEYGDLIPNFNELQTLEKLRHIDDEAKEMIITLLNREYDRCDDLKNTTVTSFPQDHLGVKAAHNDNATSAEELEKINRDLDSLKRP